jgi:CheY-like chemotaxis protein
MSGGRRKPRKTKGERADWQVQRPVSGRPHRDKKEEMARKSTPPGKALPGSRARLRRPRVLVVDDVADNREMYMEYLKFAGFSVLGAVDGATAIEAARSHHPAVILMDLSMPGINGCGAARILKDDPATSDILIFAVTGHAEASYREQAALAGCDLFIPKPCSPRELVEHICRQLDLALPEDAASSK